MVLADLHIFKLALYVLLKTVNRYFELYKIVVSNPYFKNTYAKFEVSLSILQSIYFNVLTSQCLTLKF
jgi:hypothetical protein